MEDESVRQLRQSIRRGQILEEFRISGLPVLDEHILRPLEEQAFEAFKTIDPSDQVQVMETQKMSQMICQIRKQIDAYIQEGKLATQTLNTLPREDEYED